MAEVKRRPPGRVFRAKQIASMTVLTAIALGLLIPLWWIVVSSMRTPVEIYSARQSLVPSGASVDNYTELLTETLFLRSLANSTIVACTVTAFGTLFALSAGYAYAKLNFVGKNFTFVLLLTSMTIPGAVTLLPTFIFMSRVGLLDTLFAIILPNLSLPFAMLWMRQYVRSSVPDSVLDAAKLDGCGEFRTLRSVVAPIVRPGLAGVAIWIFLSQWNSFFVPLVFLSTDENYTYPVFLAALQGNPLAQTTHLVMAASVLSTLPIVALYIAFQRHFTASAAMSIEQA
jgi:ABC-type glycerol-3-phosphate transport system permease component